MKNIVFIVFTLFAGLQVMAQEYPGVPVPPEKRDEEIFIEVDQKAEPGEGMEKFKGSFIDKFNIPENIPLDITQATVKIRFVVEKDGSFTDIRVKNNEYGLGQEAIRVLKRMPKWRPAKIGGRVVRSYFTWTFAIVINNTEEEQIDEEDNKVYPFVQQKAEPKDGMDVFRRDFQRKFRMPKDVPPGIVTIVIKFIIEKDGSLTNYQVENNEHELEQEVIRVLKTMPKWKPAQHEGAAVQSNFTWTLSITVSDTK